MALPAETVNVSFQAGQATTQASFTGARLLNVFDAAGGARLPNDTNNAWLRVTVMVTGADGYQVALGWGELEAAALVTWYQASSCAIRGPHPRRTMRRVLGRGAALAAAPTPTPVRLTPCP